jgi:hypothetical protein
MYNIDLKGNFYFLTEIDFLVNHNNQNLIIYNILFIIISLI